MEKVQKKTGLDPANFYDLVKLVELANAKNSVPVMEQSKIGVSNALDKAARILAEGGYCTHYPGYTCGKGFTSPGVCEACIKQHLLTPDHSN